MKRLVALLLAALMLFSLASCSLYFDYGDGERTEPFEEKPEELPLIDDEETEEQPTEEEEPSEEKEEEPEELPEEQEETAPAIDKFGHYTTKEDVALYIHTYGHLPENFVTKKQAKAKHWTGGSLEPYYPGEDKCIGGDYFGNYEGTLPEAEDRTYHECDIDTMGRDKRGVERIVFSDDGLIYYSDNHYASFELLYGEE